MMDGYRVAAALALMLAPLLQGCATAGPAHGAHSADSVIPFSQATVERVAGSGAHELRWSAPGATKVQVFASSSASPTGRDRPIGMDGAQGQLKTTPLPTDRRWFFEIVPDRGTPLIVAERSVGLATAPNLRDVGGYRTADGRWVRMGLVYRSDQLNRLNDPDLALLSTLNIGTVADLRTRTERESEPDRVPAGAQHVVLDVAAGSSESLGGDMRQAMAAIASGRGEQMMIAANREFVTLESARRAYRDLLMRIAAPDGGALLYHCTAGKDRTGWASAILLTILGVPRATIMEDYIASNAYLAEKNGATLAALAKSGHAINPDYLKPVLGVEPAYIEAAFAEAETRYGSMDAYVRDGLGIDAVTIARLKSKLLAGAPGR